LRRGILYERGNAEWCRWLAGAVEEKPEGAGKPEKPGEESERVKEGA